MDFLKLKIFPSLKTEKTKVFKKRPIVFTLLNESTEDLSLVKRFHLFKARHQYVQNALQLVV